MDNFKFDKDVWVILNIDTGKLFSPRVLRGSCLGGVYERERDAKQSIKHIIETYKNIQENMRNQDVKVKNVKTPNLKVVKIKGVILEEEKHESN